VQIIEENLRIMEKYFEDLLCNLHLDDVERDCWYKARYYVQEVMPPLDGIASKSSEYVYVVIENIDNHLMQAVVRQICMIHII